MRPADSALASSLRSAGFRGEVLCEEPLASHTTWRIGGPAELFASPADRDDAVIAVRWAGSTGVPWRVLGNGSNLLVRDEGVRGLVVRMSKTLDAVRFDGTRVEAGAGALLPAVANEAAARSLSGLEFAAGIPGTIGGAVLMNAGWHEHQIGSAVETVEFLEANGEVVSMVPSECAFGYRSSALRRRPGIVLSVALELRPGDPLAIRDRMAAFAASRKASQPTELPSCGSVFLKPEGDFAGRLIEAAGLKGLRVGRVEVSRKHANFFVNLGGGTAADALALVERVENEVESKLGVRLAREFDVW